MSALACLSGIYAANPCVRVQIVAVFVWVFLNRVIMLHFRGAFQNPTPAAPHPVRSRHPVRAYGTPPSRADRQRNTYLRLHVYTQIHHLGSFPHERFCIRHESVCCTGEEYDSSQSSYSRLARWYHHRVLRFLHLRHCSSGCVPRTVLPFEGRNHRASGFLRYLRRRIHRAPPRFRDLRPLRRQDWP